MRVVDKNEIKKLAIEKLKEKIAKEKITLYWTGESHFKEELGKLDFIEANDLIIETGNVMFWSGDKSRDIKDIINELENDLSKIISVNFVVKVIKMFDTKFNYCFVCSVFDKVFKINTSVISAFKKKAGVFKETNYYWCFLELCDEIFELDEKDIVNVIVEML